MSRAKQKSGALRALYREWSRLLEQSTATYLAADELAREIGDDAEGRDERTAALADLRRKHSLIEERIERVVDVFSLLVPTTAAHFAILVDMLCHYEFDVATMDFEEPGARCAWAVIHGAMKAAPHIEFYALSREAPELARLIRAHSVPPVDLVTAPAAEAEQP